MTPLLLLLAATLPAANAAVPDLYGMGPENMGMASASTALADDPYAAFYNPAGLTQLRHVTLNLAPVVGQANLWGFPGIVYDTNGDGETTDGQGYPDFGYVGTDYRPTGATGKSPLYTNGIMLGVAFPIRRTAALGLAAYVPSASLLGVETADPYMPYYLRYKSQNNRFSLTPAVAIQPFRGIHIGVGVQAMANLSATGTLSTYAVVETFPAEATARRGADEEDGSEEEASANEVNGVVKASVQDLKISAMPTMAFNYGVLIDLSAFSKSKDPDTIRKLRRHAIGASYRAPWKARTSADITAGTYGKISFGDETLLLSELTKEPIQIELDNLVAFYTPASASVGIRTGVGDAHGGPEWSGGELARLTLTADAVWTQWSAFKETVTPYTEMNIESLEGTGVTVQVGDDYGETGFHDTISYRAGLRYTIGPKLMEARGVGGMKIHLRAGGAYEPTPVPPQKGLTNYIDNDRYVAAGGVGIELGHLHPIERFEPIAKGPVRFDIGGQYHYLTPRTMVKDEDLLTDANGDGYVEYPRGYPLGGSITSGGNTWVVTAGLQLQFSEPPRPVKGIRNLRDKEEPLPELPLDGLLPLEPGAAGPDADPSVLSPGAVGEPGALPDGLAPVAPPDGASPDGAAGPTAPDGAKPTGTPDGAAPTGGPDGLGGAALPAGDPSAPAEAGPEGEASPESSVPADMVGLDTPPAELSRREAKKAARAAKAAGDKAPEAGDGAIEKPAKKKKRKKGEEAGPAEAPEKLDEADGGLEDEPADGPEAPEPGDAPTPTDDLKEETP